LFKAFSNNLEPVAVMVCEGGEFWIILAVQDAGEEVVLQVWYKVLTNK
jgi:hypothetical protein